MRAVRSLDIKKLFYETTDNVVFQMFRYVFVGGIAFIADWGSLFLITQCGVYYLVSAVISFIIGLIVNYILSKIFIFKKEQTDVNPVAEFIVYGIIGVIGLGLTEVIMYLLTTVCGLYYMISKVIAAIIVLIWNFVARKLTLYRKSKKERSR